MFWNSKTAKAFSLRDVHIRALHGWEEFPKILEIERASFPEPWEGDEFWDIVAHSNSYLDVAEFDCRIVGYIAYVNTMSVLEIKKIAVAPYVRRNGIGKMMFQHLEMFYRISQLGSMITEVTEVNVPAQIFYKHQGMRHVRTVRSKYGKVNGDAYIMRFFENQAVNAPLSPSRLTGGYFQT